jgi:DNA-binding FadR family transcriptional regulator
MSTEQDDIEDLMEVRIALESVSTAAAARKRSDASFKSANLSCKDGGSC